MYRAFVTPLNRLLQSLICSLFFFNYKEKRITLVRSENNEAKTKAVCFYAFFILLISFSSCTKVIHVPLNDADKQLVIEGTIAYGDTSFPQVKISQTKSFEDNNSFVGVSGAKVTIQVNHDKVYQLNETQPGIYKVFTFNGNPGSTYNLTVTLNGKTYTSTSTMPAQIVPLDSIWAESLTFGGKTNITIYPSYKDPPGLGNSYRLVEYKNDVQVKHVFEQNDELSDGLIITRPLVNPDGDIAFNDAVRVELQCIDADVYKYWFSVDQSATGANQSASPANPVTNIVGGALGYFSAYSVTSQTIVL